MASPLASMILPSTTMVPELTAKGWKRLTGSAAAVICLFFDVLDNEPVTLLDAAVTAIRGVATILTGAVLCARGRGGLGPLDVQLDRLVEIGTDLVDFLRGGGSNVLDLLFTC